VTGDIEHVHVLEQQPHIIQTLLGTGIGTQLGVTVQMIQ
jgi:hypothetical protein